MAVNNPIVPEGSIIRGLVLDSRDLFSREAYEQRIDRELAELVMEFRKNKEVDKAKVRKVVGEFMQLLWGIIAKLEDSKRRAESEEARKIGRIRSLLAEGAKTGAKELRKELERFGGALKSNTISALRYNRRRESQLRKQRAPFGFVLKKLSRDTYLDAEVAKKAFRLGEHTSKEPQMFSEIDYLISMLNKNPNKAELDELKKRIFRLAKSYESDLNDFLAIEVDIEIEEARKFHRIDHYIAFLKMARGFDDLIRQLNELKKRAEYWVYQDAVNAKKLEQYAVRSMEYGEKLLKSSQIGLGGEFPNIEVEKHTAFEEFPGLLMYDRTRPMPNRGIVLAHGAFGTKEALLTLGKRLATQDFVVFSIDLASHGENTNVFRLGLISEQILMAVSFLRRMGIRNVGVVGHSLGAICTLFAICGYNSRIEYQFFDATAKLLKKLDEISRYFDKLENELKKNGRDWKQYFLEKAKYDLIQSSEEYSKLKEVILNGLREMYEGNSRIDAAVLLAPPKTSQFFFPGYLSGTIKHLPGIVRKPFAKFFTDMLFFSKYKKTGEAFTVPEYVLKGMNEPGKVRVQGADVTALYETFDYVQHLKNPYDYIGAIKRICEQFHSPDKKADFVRYFVNLIRNTPKLYIYGLGDIYILKSFLPRMISENFRQVGRFQINELEDHYRDFGGEIMRMPGLNHSLTVEGNLAVFGAARMPKITYRIVTFFNQYSGRGRLFKSQADYEREMRERLELLRRAGFFDKARQQV